MPTNQELAATVAELLDRMARIEERVVPVAAPEADTRFWALEALRAVAGTDGRLVFAGTVELPAGLHYEWQEEHVAAGLLDADWSAVAAALGALGHPVRLAVLRAVLGGRHTIGALGELPELASSGQVYHHLRELQAAGWVRQAGRNHYVVPGERVVPLLVALAAAGLRGTTAQERS
jgi:DNA-binding transcriptional ArsR family regulator